MSHLDDRFASNQITVWRLQGRDINGDATYRLIDVVRATWKAGQGVKRDAQGVEFVPKDVYYPASSADIRRGDIVAQGDHRVFETVTFDGQQVTFEGQPVTITDFDAQDLTAQATGDVVRMTVNADNSFFAWSQSLQVMTE